MSPNLKLPISVLIIARNEEAHISRALNSVAFADDVVVIDGESIDVDAALGITDE